jgi:biopolymer transport protein ExbB
MVANSKFSGWVVVAMVLLMAAMSFTSVLAQEASAPATQEPQATGTDQQAAGDQMPGATHQAAQPESVGEALPTLAAGSEEAPATLPPQGYLIETFQKGGVFMWPLLICSVIGLAVVLERAWTFSRAKVNTRQFMSKVIGAMKEDGLPGAIEVCQRTRGPIAAILHAGLMRAPKGPEEVEKAIENAGAIEMSFLQRGLIILASVVNIAPMLGFLGTVSGMIHAFEAIAAAEQVSAKLVASGISEALITTEAGLVIAIPVQIANNFFISRIDRFVLDMEEASVELVDTLVDMERERTA